MVSKPNVLPTATRVLGVLLALACSGCHVLRIPSYRSDSSPDGYSTYSSATLSGSDALCSDSDAVCPPGILPPLPHWLAKWRHQEEELPKPPDSPRFHGLPTRPMFSQRKISDYSIPDELASPPTYGELPASNHWRSPGLDPLMGGGVQGVEVLNDETLMEHSGY